MSKKIATHKVNKQGKVNRKGFKSISLPRKQRKNFSQNNKKFLNEISLSGFRLLK